MAQNEKLSVGDVVVLKSGGPVMTIERYSDKTSIGKAFSCVWFQDKERKSGFFVPESLTLVDSVTD